MTPLKFFVEEFITKNRRERWKHYFARTHLKDSDIQRLPHHLNEWCKYHPRNAKDIFNQTIQGYEHEMAFVTDLREIQLTLPLGDVEVNYFSDVLVITVSIKKAFFFDHHSGIWLCEQP
ncbi:hypothetical protein [Pantoea agglomerans]